MASDDPEWGDQQKQPSVASAINAFQDGMFSKKIKKMMAGVELDQSLAYDELPPELCDVSRPCDFSPNGTDLNLRQWSLVVVDKSLQMMAERNREILETGLSNQLEDLDAQQGRDALSQTLVAAMRRRKSIAGQLLGIGLRSLDIHGATRIGDLGLKAIGNTCKLEFLDIGGAFQVTDIGMRAIAITCTGLTSLNIKGCLGIQGPGFGAIGQCCAQLVNLNVSGCRQLNQASLLRLFDGCRQLQQLDLSHCSRVNDFEVRVLAQKCTQLRNLNLRECKQVSDVGILAISQYCFALEKLDVSRTELSFKVTDVGILALGERCLVLSKLNLNGCDMISDVGLSWLAKGCVALQWLDLSGCDKISNAGLRALAEGCRELRYLMLNNMKKVTDVGLRHLSKRCQQLETLNLAGVFLLSDGMVRDFGLEGLQALAVDCVSLTSLDLCGCFQVSNVALAAIGNGLTNLKALNLAGCVNIKPKGIAKVAGNCTQLEDLNFAGCGEAFTDAMLQRIATHCPKLTNLNLTDCDSIVSSGLRAVAKCCKGLRVLNLTRCGRVPDIVMLHLSEAELEPGLATLILTGCSNITDTGVSWLAEGCTALITLSLKGTRVGHSSLRAIKDTWPCSELRKNSSFYGMWPMSRYRDRRVINAYGKVWKAATKLQSVYRARQGYYLYLRRKREFFMVWTARKLQAIFRGKLGRAEAARKLRELLYRNESATLIQVMIRIFQARGVLQRLKDEAYLQLCIEMSILVQQVWRGVMGREFVRRLRTEMAILHRRQRFGAREFQRLWRGLNGRREFARVLAAKIAWEKKLIVSARKIQKVYRGVVARRRVARHKERLAEETRTKIVAALYVQSLYRCWRCRNIIGGKAAKKRQKHKAATYLQSLWRARQARLSTAIQTQIMRNAKEQAALLKIQAAWRARQGRAYVRLLEQAKKQREIEIEEAVRLIQRVFRGYQARKFYHQEKMQQLELIQRMADMELWAATTIEAGYRGKRARDVARTKKVGHMKRWKEMYDEEQKHSFYYNQISGEIRWRKPQDMLDLMPRPSCNNCEYYAATVECNVCNEYFCGECWGTVHHGGKRKLHPFRTLYDFYDKRVDYGDGEFPSKWPSEVAQDDMDGWSLRISTAQRGSREPVETHGDWQVYASAEEGTPMPTLFYYNTTTEESTYDRPESIAEIDLLDTQHPDLGTEPGSLSGEPGALASYTPGSSQTDGSSVVPTAGPLWERFHDDEYGIDYYFNNATEESTYERPEGYKTPRAIVPL